MKKRIKLIIILVVLVSAVVYGGIFVTRNVRGIVPLLRDAGENITRTISTEESPLSLPPGFSISIFAQGLKKPRVLIQDPSGNLMVSIPSEGKVVALPDKDKSGVADRVVTVIDGLQKPHGLAVHCFPLDRKGIDPVRGRSPLGDRTGFRGSPASNGVEHDCVLYIAETDQVAVYAYDREQLQATRKQKILNLPQGGNHTTRTLLLHPDKNRLLISVGSSCNVCNESDNQRATILVSELNGSAVDIFARGLRNAVFMMVHPITEQIWATEMGRDLLGDDLPPDEINIIEEGKNYGWPICYGKNVHDTEYDKNVYIRNPCLEPFETPSHIDLQAHSSPLGLVFIPENSLWPREYWNNLLVAYHGSWNRSVPTGYKVVRFILDEEGEYSGREDFITGWLHYSGDKRGIFSSSVLGRPVGLLIDEEGTLFISDDRAGVIYRVVYTGT